MRSIRPLQTCATNLHLQPSAVLVVLCTWGEAAIVWHGTCNGYNHKNSDVQQRINQSKTRHAPVRARGGKYILVHFRNIVLGKEEWERQKNLNHKVDATVDWTVVRKLHNVHRLL